MNNFKCMIQTANLNNNKLSILMSLNIKTILENKMNPKIIDYKLILIFFNVVKNNDKNVNLKLMII